jgi:hypothetical protein
MGSWKVSAVNSIFEEFNHYVYNSVRSLVYDMIIWCLGPMVHESRDYGLLRWYLALLTRRCCRRWLAGN